MRTGSAATIVLTLTDDEWVDDDDDGADWSDTDDEVREPPLRAILSAQVDEEAGLEPRCAGGVRVGRRDA